MNNPWAESIHRRVESLKAVLELDPFKSWSDNMMPETGAEDSLRLGLEALYGQELELAKKFFVQARDIAQRIWRERKLESEDCKDSYPLNRGTLRRTDAYAFALLNDPGSIEGAALLGGAADFEEWCEGYSKKDWDSQAQAYYLDAVRLRAIAGDIDGASGLLRTKRSLSWHREEVALLKQWTEGKPSEWWLHKDFVSFFDRIRQPRFPTDVFLEEHIVRFEWAALLSSASSPSGFDRERIASLVAFGAVTT